MMDRSEPAGWWIVQRSGRIYGRDYPKGGQEQWYLIWTHGDDPETLRGPFPSEADARAASPEGQRMPTAEELRSMWGT